MGVSPGRKLAQFDLGVLDWFESSIFGFILIVSCLLFIIVNLLNSSHWEVVSVDYFQSWLSGVRHIAGAWAGRIRPRFVSNSIDLHTLEID